MADRKTSGDKLKKHDQGKSKWSLMPWDVLIDVVKVFQNGTDKYGMHNWRQGTLWTRYWDAAMRHMVAWHGGEKLDSDSGLHHLAHAICCLLFVMWYEKAQVGEDDRWTS